MDAKNRHILTLEVPHQGEPIAWLAMDQQDFIRIVQESVEGGGYHYEEYGVENIEDLMEVYEGQLPAEMAEIITKHGRVIQTTLGLDAELKSHSPDSAPSEFDFYQDVVDDRVRYCAIMSVGEAREYASTSDPKEAALLNALLDYHF